MPCTTHVQLAARRERFFASRSSPLEGSADAGLAFGCGQRPRCDACGVEAEIVAGRCRNCGWNAEKVERECLHCGRLVILKTALPVTVGVGAGLPAVVAYRVVGKAGVMAITTFIWAGSFFLSAFTVRRACSICGREVPKELLTEDEVAEARKERFKMLAIAGASAVACLVFGNMWLGSAGAPDGDEGEPEDTDD